MSTQRFCSDCKHHKAVRATDHFCQRGVGEISLVTGREYVVAKQCWREREITWWPLSKRCGPEGKYWEAKA